MKIFNDSHIFIPEAGTGTGHCPEHSSSCRVINGKGESMGEASSKLLMDKGEVKLEYITSNSYKPSGCVDVPKTTIFFKCPKRGGVSEMMSYDNYVGERERNTMST